MTKQALIAKYEAAIIRNSIFASKATTKKEKAWFADRAEKMTNNLIALTEEN